MDGGTERFLAFVRAGDRTRIEDLLREHRAGCLMRAQQILGNAADAEDAVQDAFLRLVRVSPEYDGSVPFGAWLGRLVLDASLDLRRSATRRWQRERRAGSAPEVRPGADGPSEDERVAQLRRLVGELPDELKAPIELRFFAGLSQRQTAEHLGVSENVVAVRIHRGKQRLRIRMTQAGVLIVRGALDAELAAAAPGAGPPAAASSTTIWRASVASRWIVAALLLAGALAALPLWWLHHGAVTVPTPASAPTAASVSARAEADAIGVVPGVLVYRSAPIANIQVIAPLPDHNVVTIARDAATASFRVTVNGRTAAVPTAGIAQIVYQGGAGGSDQLTVSDATVQASLYGGRNRANAADGAFIWLNLFGDYDTVDASGGQANYNVYDGVHNTYRGRAALMNRCSTCIQTAIPGVFVAGQGSVLQLYIVSPRAQGNVVAISQDRVARTTTVTENGASVTLGNPIISTDYRGSWNGSDSITCQGGSLNATIYGAGNRLALTDVGPAVWIWGDRNTILATRSPGPAWVHGMAETISGLTATEIGPAPVGASLLPGN